MKEERERIRELSSLWNGVMNRYRSLYDRVPKKETRILSDTEIAIVRIIGRGTKTIVGDIVKSLQLPKSTVTGLIARLEQKGFIQRKIYPDDLRSFSLVLTDRGKRAVRETERQEEEFFAKLIEPLSEKESRALLDLLRSIISQGGQ
ncbi:MAG: MarR family transcriptional regulator [Oscillospiraceae bacterium]|nr:MarR family transcriptional regulator [Oscillospiraceae bacterium]